MQPDDELCLCFHVTRRKITNFLRIERPRRASQLAACQGAGTGCGWCRPFLRRLFDEFQNEQLNESPCDLPSRAEYAQQRDGYIREGNGKPPA